MLLLYVNTTVALHMIQTSEVGFTHRGVAEDSRLQGCDAASLVPDVPKDHCVDPELVLTLYVDLLTLTWNVKFEVIVRNAENQRRNVVLSVQFVDWKSAFMPLQSHGFFPFFEDFPNFGVGDVTRDEIISLLRPIYPSSCHE
jgi:hypothetical protein